MRVMTASSYPALVICSLWILGALASTEATKRVPTPCLKNINVGSHIRLKRDNVQTA
jgi:hypothetical protein